MDQKNAKQQIKDALAALMLTRPFHTITITDITKQAHINRGTYYYHYYQKEEVLQDILNEAINDLFKEMKAVYHDSVYFEINKQILPSTQKLFDYIYDHRHYYKALLNSEIMYVFEQKFIDAMKSYVQHALSFDYQDSHIITIDKELYSTYQAYTVLGTIKLWMANNFNQSPQLISEQFTYLLGLKVKTVNFHLQE